MCCFDDPTDFLRLCKDRISPIIRLEGIGFNPPKRAPATKDIWELNGYYQSAAETPKQSYRVLPLVTTKLNEYWLSIQLAFVFIRGLYILDWISMSVFEGDKSDKIKNAILRAEWAMDDPKQRTNHAQPHWHIFSTSPYHLKEITSKLRSLESYLDQGDGRNQEGLLVDNPAYINIGKFHFAMASQWHDLGAEAQIQQFEVNKVLNWIEGCLLYIVNQFTYIDKAA